MNLGHTIGSNKTEINLDNMDVVSTMPEGQSSSATKTLTLRFGMNLAHSVGSKIEINLDSMHVVSTIQEEHLSLATSVVFYVCFSMSLEFTHDIYEHCF